MDYDEICGLPVATRVANGARWLDENFPGWEERVDMETLDLSNSAQCICGQVFADEADKQGYWYAEQTLFSEANSWINIPKANGHGYDAKRSELVALFLGFNIEEDDNAWNDLEYEWRELLRGRSAVGASL